MLKSAQIAQLRDLIAEGNRLLELHDQQSAENHQQCIEALEKWVEKAEMGGNLYSNVAQTAKPATIPSHLQPAVGAF